MTEVRTTSSTGGEKGVKPERYDLIPVEALASVARLYGEGAKKYAENNWRRGYEYSKSISAIHRHLAEFCKGVDIDPETGQPHLAAVIFHSLALITFVEEHPEFDDRYKRSIPEEDALAILQQKLLDESGGWINHSVAVHPPDVGPVESVMRNGYTNQNARETGWTDNSVAVKPHG